MDGGERNLSEIDRLIIKILKEEGKPISTYMLTKKIGISWATVNIHCHKLMSAGKISGEMRESISGRKMFWWIER